MSNAFVRVKRDGWRVVVAGVSYRVEAWDNDGAVVWQVQGGTSYTDGRTWAAAARRMRDRAPGSEYEAWTALINDGPVPWWMTP